MNRLGPYDQLRWWSSKQHVIGHPVVLRAVRDVLSQESGSRESEIVDAAINDKTDPEGVRLDKRLRVLVVHRCLDYMVEDGELILHPGMTQAVGLRSFLIRNPLDRIVEGLGMPDGYTEA